MIWISFSSNILILLTALILFKINRNRIISSHFIWFIVLTGFSSGVAAFGHLPLINERWANSLLLISRLLSLVSIYLFTNGSLDFASFRNNRMIRLTNVVLFVTMVVVLVWNNMFLPVMVYGIVGFMGIGLSAYISQKKDLTQGRYSVVQGILILSLSALVFALFKDNYYFLATNISHLLVSFSLVLFSSGFVELK